MFDLAQTAPAARRYLGAMGKRVAIILGHPDPDPARFVRALAAAYARNILGFCGIAPVRATFVGMIEGIKEARRKDWLQEMAQLGRQAR